MAKRTTLDWIVLVLVVVGGLNWGLVGIGGWNVVNMILGSIPILEKIVYILVGIAALYMIYVEAKKK